MKILITGGAGFIGRWITKRLLDEKNDVWVLDNLSNSDEKNLEEFKNNPHFKGLIIGDIRDKKLLSDSWKNLFDICIHLAAQINTQNSIDNPFETFDINVTGTFNILEEARKHMTKVVLVGTCMVYDASLTPINENSPIKPASPYAASKLSAEFLALSYYYAYSLPVVILRPFNIYGPFQKSDMEGGVISVFINKKLEKKPLFVFGDGNQTRDFLYVEDCADFIVKSAFSDKIIGEILNTGLGTDISINDLAILIAKDIKKIKHVKHPHPQSEIFKLICDYSKARKLLNWEPKIPLEKGIKLLEEWLSNKNK